MVTLYTATCTESFIEQETELSLHQIVMCHSSPIKMGDNENGRPPTARGPIWKRTKTEDNQNEKLPKWKTTKAVNDKTKDGKTDNNSNWLWYLLLIATYSNTI